MQNTARHPALDHLDAMVGEWETTGSHALLPGAAIRGRATFEWLDGKHFLIWRASYEHPDIPNCIAIIGRTGAGTAEAVANTADCTMTYFDSRGVSRVYQFDAEPNVWRFWRDSPQLAQRYVNTISADRQSVAGNGEISHGGKPWEPDLQLTYRRVR